MAEPAVFKTENLWFGYGRSPVLAGFDLELAAGRFHGLIGPNGCGKTTLIDLLTGRRRPDSGRALFMGEPSAELPRRRMARQVALVPQEQAMSFAFSVAEVVMMGRHPHLSRFGAPSEEDRRLVDSVLAELGLAELARRPVTALSGGEKRRTVLARALAQDAPVLVLDEPTANLDIGHALDALAAVAERVRRQGRTAVAVMHDLNLAAAFCDELVFIHRGRVHAAGPTTKVLTPENIETVFGVEARIDWQDYLNAPAVFYRRMGVEDA